MSDTIFILAYFTVAVLLWPLFYRVLYKANRSTYSKNSDRAVFSVLAAVASLVWYVCLPMLILFVAARTLFRTMSKLNIYERLER